MNAQFAKNAGSGELLELMAFSLHGQAFCVKTTSIREIRSYSVATPLPHAPREVVGLINLRGSVIPIVDLALKLGMKSIDPNERCAIIVAEVQGMAIGLVVERVSDILTVGSETIQPMPDVRAIGAGEYSDGIIIHQEEIICLLNLARMFEGFDEATLQAA